MELLDMLPKLKKRDINDEVPLWFLIMIEQKCEDKKFVKMIKCIFKKSFKRYKDITKHFRQKPSFDAKEKEFRALKKS
jgi:hypothetical protein